MTDDVSTGGKIISIHALLAESDPMCIIKQMLLIISIHALLAESDENPLRQVINRRISIHALLAESDLGRVEVVRRMWNFYPRSPCGERPCCSG